MGDYRPVSGHGRGSDRMHIPDGRGAEPARYSARRLVSTIATAIGPYARTERAAMFTVFESYPATVDVLAPDRAPQWLRNRCSAGCLCLRLAIPGAAAPGRRGVQMTVPASGELEKAFRDRLEAGRR